MIAHELGHPVAALLRDFALGALEEDELTEVAAHLDQCPQCQTRVDEYLASERFLQKVRDADSVVGLSVEGDAERQRAARALLREVRDGGSAPGSPRHPDDSAPREVAAYAIERELGRGGMGVVYRARHRGLQRIVALKMILAGQFASEAQRQRFRREAELAARVHHPNIVQIYEVGLVDGRPFLALEYVEGGTLADRQERRPLNPRASAQLVEVLARAVHHAHQKGIVHRDLKPSNVLLEESAAAPSGTESVAVDPAEGPYVVPKITDFGLARSSEPVAGLTESGMVVGTPSYISPEQARGAKELGPAADIYSLGAILYDLLARRPPFLAETPLETVQQVLDQEPARPSRWLAGVPLDLETICLKCLEKDPAKRFVTAEALADDLRKWRRGEEISARRTSALERLAKWCRKRPALAASLFAVGALAMAVTVISTLAAIRLRAERNAVLDERARAVKSERQRQIALVDSVLNAVPASVPYMLETLAPSAGLVLPLLRDRFERGTEATPRLRAAVGLTVLGEPQTEFLLDAVPQTHPAESGNLALAFRKMRNPGVATELVARSIGAADLRIRARYAILLLDLGDVRGVQPLLAFSPDLNPRSTLIDEFQAWHGDLAALPAALRACDDAECRAGLCAAVGRVDPNTLSTRTRDALAATLASLFEQAPDPGTHSAADWALRQWNAALPPVPATSRAAPGARWFLNGSGLTMIGVSPEGIVYAPPHLALLTRPYFMSDREISLGLFRQFIDDPSYPAAEKPGDWKGPWDGMNFEPECPVNNVAETDAILFCNWLSAREGRRPCYFRGARPRAWSCDMDADGYRMPSEGEWNYAARAGAANAFPFGDDPGWTATYAHTSAVQPGPGRAKLPSRWGFFDMTGNVWDICAVEIAYHPTTIVLDPAGVSRGRKLVAKGGGFDSGSHDTRVSFATDADIRSPSMGFRVVCRDPAPVAKLAAGAEVLLNRVIEQAPGDGFLLQLRADFRGTTARWDDVAADLNRAFALDPTKARAGCRVGSLFVRANQRSAYRVLCQTLIQRFAATTNVYVADHVARTCLLAPDGLDNFAPVIKLVELARSAQPLLAEPLGELPCAMAEYRTGRFADAARRLKALRVGMPLTANRRVFAVASFFEAMAEEQGGQHSRAEQLLAEAKHAVAGDYALAASGTVTGDWEELVIAEITDREATALVRAGNRNERLGAKD